MLVSRQRVTRLPRRGAQWLACLLAVVLAGGATSPAMAYQTYTVQSGGRVVTLKWQHFPVRYFVSDRAAGGISADDLQSAVSRAFNTWQGVSTARVSAQFGGFTPADPFDDDGMTTLGFLSRPDLDRVLGATAFLIDTTTGEIVESDIFFNSAFPWSVSASGESGKYDLESIALHEIGHLFGLGHSAIGETELLPGGGRRVIAAESVMFPIAFSAGNTSGRTPRADDVAGLSDLYPSDTFTGASGAISGRVTKNGQGVYGAHVVAFDPKTGKLVGGFTVDSNGSFTIGALDPGAYVLRVEPVDDADLDAFFDDPESVDLDFAITFFDRYVIVPRGGTSGTIEVQVKALSGTSSVLPAPTSRVTNPTTIEFEPSADHANFTRDGRALVDHYDLEIYRRNEAQPFVVAELGKPGPGGDGIVQLDLAEVVPVWPLPTGVYEACVTAVGPTGAGRSDPSNTFSFGFIIDRDPGLSWIQRLSAWLGRPAPLAYAGSGALGRPAARAALSPALGASQIGLSIGERVGDGAAGQAAGQRPAGPAPKKAPARKARQPGRPGSFEVSASALYLGSSSLGSSTATLTPNQTGTGDRYTYFQTSSQMQGSAGFEARLAYNLTRMFAVEGGMTYSRPGVGLTVSSDAEGAAGLSVTGEQLTQYFFDVAGVVAFRSSKPGKKGRWTPFAEGGIGYLRQLHELKTLVETGQVFHGGGGVKYRLSSSPTSFVTGISLRIDARFYYLNKGFSFDDKSRVFPAFGGGLEIAF
jgi:hypothetical protein